MNTSPSSDRQASAAKPVFLEGVPVDLVLARLSKAGGNEVESGKLASKESSAALAVNTFGWFMERPGMLPHLPTAPTWGEVLSVDVEYCARFPWTGGRHPWLDAAIETKLHLVGIESKRFEPFRDRKTVSLSNAYDRPKWGAEMRPFERMRDELRANPKRFHFLDAAQLVKHAFGLVTDARRKGKRPHLHYLFAEPRSRNGAPISAENWSLHRAEIAGFAAGVAGAEVGFSACSYREWLATWSSEVLRKHAERLVATFNP